MSAIENGAKLSPAELTCPICLQLFSEPVSLPCDHTFCLLCLQTMGEGLDQHSCPDCQAEYQENSALVKNLEICSMVEAFKANAGEMLSPASLCDLEKADRTPQQDLINAGESGEKNANNGFRSESSEPQVLLDQEKSCNEGQLRMQEPKCKLACQVTDLCQMLDMAETVLRKEEEKEQEVTTRNNQVRENVSKLLTQMMDLTKSYSEQVTQLIEVEFGPGEASVCSRVSEASELTMQLKDVKLKAVSLLTEEEETAFNAELQNLQPHIEEMLASSLKEKEKDNLIEDKPNLAQLCPKLEIMNSQLRESFGDIQRSLRNTFNPSEVTFDPQTVHPNLILSDDLKTVTFSAVKQPYPASPQRFINFFQVLSTQSFSEGEHSWEVELDGSPWIIGVCCHDKLARSGLPSALESSQSSWCLMWIDNMLVAFDRGKRIPLMKTTVSCRLEIKLSFKTQSLSFSNISVTSGKTHVHTFKANLTEPVNLAYRMMSGHPKAHVTIHS